MTILWCGGEDIDFVGSTAGNTPTDLSRYGISGSYAKSLPFTSITSCWLSFSIRSAWSGVAGDPLIIGLINYSTNNSGIWIQHFENKLRLVKYNGTTIIQLAIESQSSAIDAYVKYDIELINYSTNGTINIYINGLLQMTYTGDISISGISNLNSICIGGYTSWHWVAEIIVSTTDTRLFRLKTLAPNAIGDTNSFTGSYADIDETYISDSDMIYSNTANQEFQCNTTGMPTGNYRIKAVKMAYRAAQTAFSLNMQHGIRYASTTYLESPVTLNTYWETKEVTYQDNPVTGVEFTPDDIENLQFALKTVTA